ncbi:MAG: acetate uptake transporter [Ktedonobacterales bacterium]|nr:acetate uptake transporter [Ktedonobacterales bacterium]
MVQRAPVSVLADPGPLGLSGFALATFVLGAVNAGILSGKGDIKIVIGLAVFYGGIAQLLAGMWEFRNNNTFGATAFTSYGAFWLSFGLLLILGFGVAFGIKGSGPTDTAVGIYLLGWAIITGILMIASLRISGALAAVFVLLFITFLLLAIGALTTNTAITKAGGWVGILTAIAAWYAALASLLRSVSNGKIALPVYPLA